MDSSSLGQTAFRGIAALEKLPLWDASNFSPIEVPKALYAQLGNPQNRIPCVHVAGTNGKGSVSSFISAMLLASGARVGQFTSPHLSHVAERCVVNGRAQEIADFDRAVSHVMDRAIAAELEPSYFVVTAAACFWEFARLELDYSVIEVGLGGLYDATNLISSPQVCVISSIGLDHTHILGERIEDIAVNKAGIAKAGVPLVVGRVPEEAREVISRKAREVSAPVYFQDQDFGFSPEGEIFGIKNSSSLSELFASKSIFSNSYQRQNLLLATKVAEVLSLQAPAILSGARRARWPGRLENLYVDSSEVLLDAAHNEDGIEALCAYVENSYLPEQCRELVFLLGILERKNWRAVVELLRAFQSRLEANGRRVHWVCTEPENSGALSATTLAATLPGALGIPHAPDALEYALKKTSTEVPLIVAGSIFLLGALRPLLTSEPFSTYDESLCFE